MTKAQRAALTAVATGTDARLTSRSTRTIMALVEAGAIRLTGGTDWRFELTEYGANLIAGK